MTEKFVEIWHGDILPAHSVPQNYYQYLNAEEKEKAATFIRPELQQRYIKIRGVLRKVLGNYLNELPEEINIKIAEFGKPFVDGSLFFNLSHTGNKFVIVVSNVSEVGIDLEQYKPRKNLSGLVRKCFSDVEKKYWAELPEQQQVTAFYQFWVRKEAFVKAIGRGISVGLDQCVVNPQVQTQFLSIPVQYGEVADWKILDIALNQGDVCALVIKDMSFNYKLNDMK